jgi:hypothetical protein
VAAAQTDEDKKTYQGYINSIQTRISELIVKIKSLGSLLMPNASKELLARMEESYEDMTKNSTVSKIDVERTKLDVTILKYLLL